MLKKLLNNEEGQSMTEYILIIALIAVALIAVIKLFGSKIAALFKGAGDKIEKEAGDFSY